MRIRYLAIIIALFVCTEASAKTTSAKPCDPLTGDAVQPQAKALNPFKNRTRAPKASEIDSNITLKKMLAPGDDTKRFR